MAIPVGYPIRGFSKMFWMEMTPSATTWHRLRAVAANIIASVTGGANTIAVASSTISGATATTLATRMKELHRAAQTS